MRRRSLSEGDRRGFEPRGKAGLSAREGLGSSRRDASPHRLAEAGTPQQGRPRRRREPLQEEAIGGEVARHGEIQLGQGMAALSSAIGGLATVRVGRRTAKRFGGQAASAGFGPQGARLTPAWMTSALPGDGFGVRAVIAEDNGRDRRTEATMSELIPAEEHEAFSRRQDRRVVATVLWRRDAIYRNRRGAAA